MNRAIDIQSIKAQNFQLKNQITDLKNGFDLNKDVLKILSEQVKQVNQKNHIFYQIISRLTGINNQIMLANVELLQDKNKLQAENKKLQNTIDCLSERLQQLMNSSDCINPKQIHMEMRNQMKQLRSEILALNQQCLRKKLQIFKLENIIKEMENQEMKKPIIPSISSNRVKSKAQQISQIQNLPKNFETKGKLKIQVIEKDLKRENAHLKRMIEQLEYRLTLLSRIYQIEPPKSMRERDYDYMKKDETCYKKLTQNQLNLLMFALNNTHLEQDPQNQSIKLTITKRCKYFMPDQEQNKIRKVSSCIF